MSVERVLGLHLGRLLGGSHQILLQSLTLAPLLLLSVQLGVEGVGQDVADSSLWRVDLVDVGLDLCERLGHSLGLREVLYTAARQLLVHVVGTEVSPHVLLAPRLDLAALERGHHVEALAAHLGADTRLVARPLRVLLDGRVGIFANIVLL